MTYSSRRTKGGQGLRGGPYLPRHREMSMLETMYWGGLPQVAQVAVTMLPWIVMSEQCLMLPPGRTEARAGVATRAESKMDRICMVQMGGLGDAYALLEVRKKFASYNFLPSGTLRSRVGLSTGSISHGVPGSGWFLCQDVGLPPVQVLCIRQRPPE